MHHTCAVHDTHRKNKKKQWMQAPGVGLSYWIKSSNPQIFLVLACDFVIVHQLDNLSLLTARSTPLSTTTKLTLPSVHRFPPLVLFHPPSPKTHLQPPPRPSLHPSHVFLIFSFPTSPFESPPTTHHSLPDGRGCLSPFLIYVPSRHPREAIFPSEHPHFSFGHGRRTTFE